MEIQEIEITSFRGFTEYLYKIPHVNNIRLFRGQEDSEWNLDSELFRLVSKQKSLSDIYQIEKHIFAKFKKGIEKLDSNLIHKTDWELLSLGRHYSLPTRLIDWTSDPLIALWFAFKNRNIDLKYRIVWGLSVNKKYLVDFEKDKLFSGRFIKIFEPKKIDIRITAQKSWFSIQKMQIFKNRGGDGLPVFNNYNTMNHLNEFDYYLLRIKIPNSKRENILNNLKNKRIHNASIFPDLNNVASPGLKKLCKSIRNKQFK